MRSKITFILLALNLAVFGYLFVAHRNATAGRTVEENRKRVLPPEVATLDKLLISLTPSGADGGGTAPLAPATLTLERKESRWFLTTPADWPANDFAIRRMLNELQFLEHETSFPVADLAKSGQSLADFGLDHPRLTLTMVPAPATPGAKAVPLTLRVGGDTAVGNRLYALSPDGSRIHVVNRTLFDHFALTEAALRSSQLFTIPVFEARALTLQTTATGPRTRLRREQDEWIFEAPFTVATRATKTRTELDLNELHSLQVSHFAAAGHRPDPAITGLATPSLRITLEGNGRRETLALGLPLDPEAAAVPGTKAVEYFARLDEREVLFTVTASTRLVADLRDAASALRDRRIIPFDPASVTGISLSDAAGRDQNRALRIQKLDSAETAWRLLPPGADPTSTLRADATYVNNLLQRLSRLEAARFANDAPTPIELEKLGFNRPERTVILQFAASPGANTIAALRSLTVEFALPGGSDPAVYARVADQPYIYALNSDALDYVPVAARVYRDRRLSVLPDTTRITRLIIRRLPSAPDALAPAPLLDLSLPAETPLSELLARETPARREAIGTLLASLRNLRAQSILREDFPATTPVDGVERPWSYVLEATLDPAPAATPLTIHFAERSGASVQLAGSSALGLVFTLEQPVLDALWALLYIPHEVTSPSATTTP